MVVGPGSTVGSFLVEHPDVAKVAFTGSTEAGRDVMARAAGTIKRVTLELGGKSANVVFADADLERAAASAPSAVFGNAGQDCCARSRILVERTVFDRFVELLRRRHRRRGGRRSRGSRHRDGPARLREPPGRGGGVPRARRRRPARRLPGPGARRTRDGGSPPTVVAPAAPGTRLWRDEVFGPVVAVTPFDDEAHAVALANDTPYGLSGSIWTARRRPGPAHGPGRAAPGCCR